jgi:hypothetical protein
MTSNVIVTAAPDQDVIERLRCSLDSNAQGSQPSLFLDFSDIRNVRVMIDAWREQIVSTGENPVTLVLDMTKLAEIDLWDPCLSGVFSERVFGASEKLPKSWSVVLVIPTEALNGLTSCRTQAKIVADVPGQSLDPAALWSASHSATQQNRKDRDLDSPGL